MSSWMSLSPRPVLLPFFRFFEGWVETQCPEGKPQGCRNDSATAITSSRGPQSSSGIKKKGTYRPLRTL